ncbi:MAG: hypothetical protein M3Z85_08940 [Acidobacteriota bacterium]|nr:hypothetical protein [Acidobacteriota bacterium]
MNIHELEARLRAHLGQPGWPESPRMKVAEWSNLARLVDDIHREAELIGTVPEKYPRHVEVVIRFVHALLPWYTRPLRAFGGNCANAFDELLKHVSEVARNQNKILARLDRVEQTLQDLGRQAP